MVIEAIRHRAGGRVRMRAMNGVQRAFANQGLSRPRSGRVIGGVLAGFARRFGLDPWLMRLIFVVVLMLLPGSQILVYPVLWLLMPSE